MIAWHSCHLPKPAAQEAPRDSLLGGWSESSAEATGYSLAFPVSLPTLSAAAPREGICISAAAAWRSLPSGSSSLVPLAWLSPRRIGHPYSIVHPNL